jgi:uncharacterized protein (TIGR01777 family)
MRVLVAGSSGFLGTKLVRSLTDSGHQVRRLVRREPATADETRWDPSGGQIDVVNLAGANINGRRWTEAYKRELYDSRVDTTATLAKAIGAAARRPAVMINSSAVGYYGDTGDRAVDEAAPPGRGFLAGLARDWEAATAPAEDAGVRVVRTRTGFPLDRGGGLLKPLLPVFRLGGGGKLGDGAQYLPWISMPDWLAALAFLLEREDLAGPVNLTGPTPVTNAEFTRALGRQVRRPTLMTVPRIGLKIALGELGDEALASQRVIPTTLTRAGFEFQHRDVAAALRWAVDHPD